MGHVRIGFLPRTKQWDAIRRQLSEYSGDANSVSLITNDTLKAMRGEYERMPKDESVIKAVTFLSILAFSAKQENQVEYLKRSGINVDENVSLYSVISSADEYVQTYSGSLEVNQIVKDAVMQSIMEYCDRHYDGQINLFGQDQENPLKRIGNGAAFCELSRSFIAKLTDRHLRYYLDRIAAAEINSLSKLERFSEAITNHSELISNHTFDIAQLTQSYAAGWFNKHVKEKPASKKEIASFLNVVFMKMREEFRREATA